MRVIVEYRSLTNSVKEGEKFISFGAVTLSGVAPEYALYDGKFVRTLSLPPDHDYTSEEIARAISDYVQLFDRLMKAYLAGKYTPPEIEALYCAEQQRAQILI